LYTRRPACLQQVLNRACHNFPPGECPGQRTVNPPSSNRPEATSGALPPFPTILIGHEEEQQTHLPVEQDIAGAAPVGPAIFKLSDAREPANPPDLGSGEARRNTGVSDHFHSSVR